MSKKPLTHLELLDRLKQIDEVSLLEMLEIYSDELVDRFQDKIEEKREFLLEELEEDDEEPQEN